MELVRVNDGTGAGKIDPAAEVCGNCGHCGTGGANRQCRAHPPQVMFLPLAAPTIQGAPPRIEWLNNSAYPLVSATTPACGEFEAKATTAN